MNEVHAPRSRNGVVVRLVLGAVFAVAAWFVLRHWTYVSGEVEWVCYSNECGTDDWRVVLAIIGVVLAVVACALLVTVLRLAGFGLMLGLAPLAAVTGWHAAVADGQVDVVSGWADFWRVVAIVGGLVAVLGLVVEFRRPGPSWRLFGWEPEPVPEATHVEAPPDGEVPSSLSTELTRLAALHAEGHLTDAEFKQAKRRVLNG